MSRHGESSRPPIKLVLSPQATARGSRTASGVDFSPVATAAVTATLHTPFHRGPWGRPGQAGRSRASPGLWSGGMPPAAPCFLLGSGPLSAVLAASHSSEVLCGIGSHLGSEG